MKNLGVTLGFLLAISGSLEAATVEVEVLSNKGSKVRNAVVYLTADRPLPKVAPDTEAIMDQLNSQFVPHILAVQKDTLVRFPNSDSIKHHVYSFSPAKTFELQLYKDQSPEPEPFETAGKVEMGCNVHDWMLGYIYVVDTPYFGQTDKQGKIRLEAPAGEYTLNIRHPRIQDDEGRLTLAVVAGETGKLKIQLEKDLLPGHELYEQDVDEFSNYE